MKKIAIIALSYGWLPGEGGATRFSSISEMLAKKGYDVTLISSSFYHIKKKKRDIKKLLDTEYPYHLFFLDEPGYSKNVCFKRMYSHYVAGYSLKKHLKTTDYDLIYCAIPPNNVTRVAATHAHKKHIPFVVDVEDLWPEAWKMVFGKSKIFDILFSFIKADAEISYKYADGIIGTSEEYRKRPFQNQSEKGKLSETVYVCMDRKEFDQGVTQYCREVPIEEGAFYITYAGTLGTSYDIPTLIRAAQELFKEGYKDIRFRILGTGPNKEEWERSALEQKCNISFLGYVPYPKMAAYLSKSDIVINSVVKKSAASIITKIGDYLSSETAMINTCSSQEFRDMVEREGFGINVEAENVQKLKEGILFLYNNPVERKAMAVRGRKYAEQYFDKTVAYQKIVKIIEEVGGWNR